MTNAEYIIGRSAIFCPALGAPYSFNPFYQSNWRRLHIDGFEVIPLEAAHVDVYYDFAYRAKSGGLWTYAEKINRRKDD